MEKHFEAIHPNNFFAVSKNNWWFVVSKHAFVTIIRLVRLRAQLTQKPHQILICFLMGHRCKVGAQYLSKWSFSNSINFGDNMLSRVRKHTNQKYQNNSCNEPKLFHFLHPEWVLAKVADALSLAALHGLASLIRRCPWIHLDKTPTKCSRYVLYIYIFNM